MTKVTDRQIEAECYQLFEGIVQIGPTTERLKWLKAQSAKIAKMIRQQDGLK